MQNIHLIRAISSEFISRKLQSITLAAAIVLTLLVIAALYLTTVNVWWWLLAVPILVITVVVSVVLLLVHLLALIFKPELSKPQHTAVADFVDKLERVAEHVQTPMPFILFNIARDMAWPRTPTFIQQVVGDSTTLHTDIAKLERQFHASSTIAN